TRRRRHTRSLRDWSSNVCSSDLHGSEDARGEPVLGAKPVLIRLIHSPQNARGRSRQHHRARAEWIVLRNQVLRHPTVMGRSPDCNRCTSALFIAGTDHIKQRLSASEHPAPVFSHLSEMRSKARSLPRIEKAGPLIQSKELIDRKGVHLDSV